MLPIEIAREKYRSGVPDTFEDDMRTHQLFGHVLSTSEYFFMWRVVSRDWDAETMLNPVISYPSGDCAFIWYLGGDIEKAADAALKITPVRYVAYERRGKLRFLDLSRVFRPENE